MNITKDHRIYNGEGGKEREITFYTKNIISFLVKFYDLRGGTKRYSLSPKIS